MTSGIRNTIVTLIAVMASMVPCAALLLGSQVPGWLVDLGVLGDDLSLVIPAIVAVPAVLQLVALAFRASGNRLFYAPLAQLAIFIGLLLAAWFSFWVFAHPLLSVLIGVTAIITILTDALFIAAGRVLLALIPLSLGYLFSAVVATSALPWYALVGVVTSWTVMLSSRTLDRVARWPRAVSKESIRQVKSVGVLLLACCLALSSTGIAFGLSLRLPDERRSFWNGPSSTQINLRDPRVELEENLRQPFEAQTMSYRTSNGQGVYLRTSVLAVLNADGWQQANMTLYRGTPTRIDSSITGAEITTEVNIDNFNSIYLPAPYAPTDWQAEGKWLYDPLSLSIVLNSDDQTKLGNGLSYSVTSQLINPSAEQIATASAGEPKDAEHNEFVPTEVPASITGLTAEITAGASSDGQKAQAIEAWLSDPANFTYTLEAPPGVGLGVLESFLFTTRAGYCIHFASSMALMSRIAGIPARVAIGFTPGEQQVDGSFVVTNHQMHAWPELYFEDLGWVRFEPTTATGADGNVEYSQSAQTPSAPPSSSEPSTPPPATETPSGEPSPASASPTPVPDASQGEGENSTSASKPAIPSWLVAVALGIGIVIFGLSAPGMIRRRQRDRRLGAAGGADLAHGAWDELRALVIDTGGQWPSGTPRQVARAAWPELDDEGRVALGRLAVAEEQALFARAVTTEADLVEDIELLEDQLFADLAGRDRFFARWWPTSVIAGPGKNRSITS